MKLSEYLIKYNINQEDIASALETTQATISRWVNGDFVPSLENMQKIIAFTKGEVTANDFYEVEE